MNLIDFIAIDFETANRYNNSACSIGIAFVSNLKIVKKEYFLIKPPTMTFNNKNISIHGITPDMVKNEPQFPVIWDKIKNCFNGRVPIFAHNAFFDMSVLHCCLDEYQLKKPNFIYLDSMRLSHSVDSKRSLVGLAKFFNITLNNHHNALDDAVCCAEIVIALIKNSGCNSFSDYLHINQRKTKIFGDVIPQKVFKKNFGYRDIKLSEMATTQEITNTDHLFYGKSFVFTGDLINLGRKEAMQKVLNLGGIVRSAVSTRTDYLVVGQQNKSVVGKDGISSKQRKTNLINESGKKTIKILNEEEFLKLLNN